MVEFIVDTGFDGELSLPSNLARHLDVEIAGHQALALADGTTIFSPYYRVLLDWGDESRLTGVLLLEGHWLHSQMTSGGEVDIEPL